MTQFNANLPKTVLQFSCFLLFFKVKNSLMFSGPLLFRWWPKSGLRGIKHSLDLSDETFRTSREDNIGPAGGIPGKTTKSFFYHFLQVTSCKESCWVKMNQLLRPIKGKRESAHLHFSCRKCVRREGGGHWSSLSRLEQPWWEGYCGAWEDDKSTWCWILIGDCRFWAFRNWSRQF